MTYGVLNDLTKIGIDIQELGTLIIDPQVRDATLRITLTPRNEEGDFDTSDGEPMTINQLKLSVDEVQDVLEWVVDHIAHFFMRSIEQAARLRAKYADRAESLLTSSLSGSENSASKSPSAGPSDAPPANSADLAGSSPSTT